MIPFRHPDRLFHVFSLKHIREGEYLSQTKYDGHYAVIIKDDNKVSVLSRHNKPLAVSPKMIASLETIGMENGDVLHGEWTSRRESNKVESMYLFNMVFMRYEWLGAIAEEERFKKLQDFKVNADVFLVENREGGYAAHYKSTIDDWKTEGIVLKLKKAKVIGDLRTPKDNPGYFKLKWREGSDGRTKAIIPDNELITRS
jgi:hypothetical protein